MLLPVTLDLKRPPEWSWLGSSCNAYKTWVREQIEGGPEVALRGKLGFL